MKNLISTILLLVFSVTININIADGQWNNVGPFGGNYLLSSANGNTIFLNDKYIFEERIFKSTNEGISWSLMGNFFFPISIGASLKATESYVFRGESNGTISRTNYGGQIWDNFIIDQYYNRVRAIESINGFLLAGVELHGIYKSTNNGVNWIDVNSNNTTGSVIKSFVSSVNYTFALNETSRIFRGDASGENWQSVYFDTSITFNNITYFANDLFATTTANGILRSTDSGNSWEFVNNGLTNLSISSLKSFGNNLFASSTENGIFTSSDLGASWIPVNNGLYRLKVKDLFITNSAIYAGLGDGGIFYSTNYGSQWNNRNAKFNHYNVTGALVSNNQFIFSSTNQGILRSSDNGDNWEFFDEILPPNESAVMTVKDNYIFRGNYFSGVSRSSDNGINWQFCATGLDITDVRSMTSNSQYVFAGRGNGIIYRTSNYGLDWVSLNFGLPSGSLNKIISFQSNLYVGTTSGLYFSSNNGNNWSNAGLNYYISDLTCNGSYLFAVARDTVYRSSNNGINWAAIYYKDTIPGANLSAIISLGNNIITGGYNKFSYSPDNGNNWTLINNEGIPMEDFNNVKDMSILNGYLYSSIWYFGDFLRRPLSEIISTVPNDVGVTGIIEPFPGEVRNLYCDNVTLNPKSQVLNYGSNAQLTLFNVNFEIKFNGSVIYSDTKQITLEISQSKTVNFTPYTIPVDQPGIYSVRSWSALQTDSNKSNDTSYSEFRANPNPNYGYSEISDYYFLNSSSNASCIPDQPVFNWEDTTGSVNLIINGVPQIPFNESNYWVGYFRLPDVIPNRNKFRFFGTTYDTLVISTNGIIGLGGSASGMLSSNPVSLPSVSAPKPAIFPFWYPCNFQDPEIIGRNLKYKFTDNKFIITFDRFPVYNTLFDSNDYVSYQVILKTEIDGGFENGDIIVQFDNTKSGSSFLNNYYNGNLNAMTVGIQNSTGSIGLLYRRSVSSHQLAVPGPLFGSPLAIRFGKINSVLPVELLSFNASINHP